MKPCSRCLLVLIAVAAACGEPPQHVASVPPSASAPLVETMSQIKTVFTIVLENADWSSLARSGAAPYINGSLLKLGAHAERYGNVGNLHPSLPNYIWMLAGATLGIRDNHEPYYNARGSHGHIDYLLQQRGISWRSYQEGISGTDCPLAQRGRYFPKHNPFVFFLDNTGGNHLLNPSCIEHNRPMAQLARDLQRNDTARFNFLTPDICNNGHDACPPLYNPIRQSDAWLQRIVPMIMQSRAYQDGGAIFITWDESSTQLPNYPIGMIVLSPLAKPGYTNRTTAWDHSSLLRTWQDIFAVGPYLGAAATASNLADLFTAFP